MRIMRGLSMLAVVVALSACTGFKSNSEVEALNEAKAVGSPFTQQLAAEYRDMANREQNTNFDYPDALHFARKGLAAASGEVVLPEPVSDWNLKPNHIEELAPARQKLVGVLDRGGRESQPQLAAVAQSRFDCWIEAQEESWQKNDFQTCKNQFMEALAALESQVGAPPPPSDVMPPVSAIGGPSGPMAPEDAKYLVFFDFDSSKVDAGGESVIDSVVAEIKKQNITSVVIIGHADTSGSKEYNKRLSNRRATSVRDALVKSGINASLLQTESRGEEELLVQTPDDVREPANRRVEVTFVK